MKTYETRIKNVPGGGWGKSSEQLVCMCVFSFKAIGLITFRAKLCV